MAKYSCATCGRTSRLPDMCCGKAMASASNFVCKSCGKTATAPVQCCSKPMVKM